MQAGLRRGGEIIEREVPVGDAVEAIGGGLVEPESGRGGITVDRKTGAGKCCGAKRALAQTRLRIREPQPIAAEHFVIGQEVVAKADRLRDLQVGETRHDRFDLLLGAQDQYRLERPYRIDCFLAGIAHP